MNPARYRTPLNDYEEQQFQQWYNSQSTSLGLSTNPDALDVQYDYRGAWRNGEGPDSAGNWPSRYKDFDHPNRFIDIGGEQYDTIYGEFTGAQSTSTAPSYQVQTADPSIYSDPQPSMVDMGGVGIVPPETQTAPATPTPTPDGYMRLDDMALTRGLTAGLMQTPRLTGKTLEALGRVTGADGLIRAGESVSDSWESSIPELQIKGFGEIQSVDDAVTFAGESIGQGIGSTAAIIGAGMAGAKVGPTAALTATGLTAYTLITGEMYDQIVQDEEAERNGESLSEEEKRTAAYTAGAIGLLSTGLEVATLNQLRLLPEPARRQLFRVLGKYVQQRRAIPPAETLKELIQKAATQSGKGFAGEGATEAIQAGSAKLGSDILFDRDWTEEDTEQVLFEGVAGGLGGAAMTGGQAIIEDQSLAGRQRSARRGETRSDVTAQRDILSDEIADLMADIEIAEARRDQRSIVNLSRQLRQRVSARDVLDAQIASAEPIVKPTGEATDLGTIEGQAAREVAQAEEAAYFEEGVAQLENEFGSMLDQLGFEPSVRDEAILRAAGDPQKLYRGIRVAARRIAKQEAETLSDPDIEAETLSDPDIKVTVPPETETTTPIETDATTPIETDATTPIETGTETTTPVETGTETVEPTTGETAVEVDDSASKEVPVPQPTTTQKPKRQTAKQKNTKSILTVSQGRLRPSEIDRIKSRTTVEPGQAAMALGKLAIPVSGKKHRTLYINSENKQVIDHVDYRKLSDDEKSQYVKERRLSPTRSEGAASRKEAESTGLSIEDLIEEVLGGEDADAFRRQGITDTSMESVDRFIELAATPRTLFARIPIGEAAQEAEFQKEMDAYEQQMGGEEGGEYVSQFEDERSIEDELLDELTDKPTVGQSTPETIDELRNIARNNLVSYTEGMQSRQEGYEEYGDGQKMAQSLESFETVLDQIDELIDNQALSHISDPRMLDLIREAETDPDGIPYVTGSMAAAEYAIGRLVQLSKARMREDGEVVYRGEDRPQTLFMTNRNTGGDKNAVFNADGYGGVYTRRLPKGELGAGLKWGYDNGAWETFTDGGMQPMSPDQFDLARWLEDVQKVAAHERAGDLQWVTLPDLIANGQESLELSRRAVQDAALPEGLPYFLAVQEGMTVEEVAQFLFYNDAVKGIFIGGKTDDFKFGEEGRAFAALAHEFGLKVHIGRTGRGRKVAEAMRLGADSVDSSSVLQSSIDNPANPIQTIREVDPANVTALLERTSPEALERLTEYDAESEPIITLKDEIDQELVDNNLLRPAGDVYGFGRYEGKYVLTPGIRRNEAGEIDYRLEDAQVYDRLRQTAPINWTISELERLSPSEINGLSRLLGITLNYPQGRRMKSETQGSARPWAEILVGAISAMDQLIKHDSASSIQKLTKEQLQDIARQAGVSAEGGKFDIVTRLVQWRDYAVMVTRKDIYSNDEVPFASVDPLEEGIDRPTLTAQDFLDYRDNVLRAVIEIDEIGVSEDAEGLTELRDTRLGSASTGGRPVETTFNRPSKEALSREAGQLNHTGKLKTGKAARRLINAIHRKFQRDGYVNLRGQKITTANELAKVAQVFRNPTMEHSHVWYVDADTGEVLAHESATSRAIGSTHTIFTLGLDFDRYNKLLERNPAKAQQYVKGVYAKNNFQFTDRVQRLRPRSSQGNITVYVSHNHPNGISRPSSEDMKNAVRINSIVDGVDGATFGGEVIVDSNEYSVLASDGTYTTHVLADGFTLVHQSDPEGYRNMERIRLAERPLEGWRNRQRANDPLLRPETAEVAPELSNWAYRLINNVQDIAELAKNVTDAGNDDVAIIVGMTAGKELVLVEQVPMRWFEDAGLDQARSYLKNLTTETGTHQIAIYYGGTEHPAMRGLAQLVDENSISDFVTIDEKGIGSEATRLRKQYVDFFPKTGLAEDEGPGMRSFADMERFGTDPESVELEQRYDPMDLEIRAVQIFGETTDPFEAGYILSDGTLLDFSGQKDGGPPGVRHMDHRQISALEDADGNNMLYSGGFFGDDYGYMFDWMRRTHAVRLFKLQSYVGFHYIAPLTKSQRAVMSRLVRGVPELHIDEDDPTTGYTLRSVEIENPMQYHLDAFLDENTELLEEDGIVVETRADVEQFGIAPESVELEQRYDSMDLEQRAVEIFGETTDPFEAGYILSDGTLLDFSGKRDGAPGGNRYMDHREINGLEDVDGNSMLYDGGDAFVGTSAGFMIDWMRRTNAVRMYMYDDSVGFNYQAPVTKMQRAVMSRLARNVSFLNIDEDNQHGRTIRSVEIENPRQYQVEAFVDENTELLEEEGIVVQTRSDVEAFGDRPFADPRSTEEIVEAYDNPPAVSVEATPAEDMTSRVTARIAEMPQAMSPKDFMTWIRKTPGMKEEAIEAHGLDRWAEGQKRINPKEALSFVAENAIQLYDHEITERSLGTESYIEYDQMGGGHDQGYEKLFTSPDGRRELLMQIQIPYSKKAVRLPTRTGHGGRPAYYGAHYGEYKNILGWVRASEARDESGNRVFIIDEIQSDWMRSARKGKTDPSRYTPERLDEIRERTEDIAEEARQLWRGQYEEALDLIKEIHGSDYYRLIDRPSLTASLLDEPYESERDLLEDLKYAADDYHRQMPQSLTIFGRQNIDPSLLDNYNRWELGPGRQVLDLGFSSGAMSRGLGLVREEDFEGPTPLNRGLYSEIGDGVHILSEHIDDYIKMKARSHAYEVDLGNLAKEYEDLLVEDQALVNMDPYAPYKDTWHEILFKRAVAYAHKNRFNTVAWADGLTHERRYSPPNQSVKKYRIQHQGKNRLGSDSFVVGTNAYPPKGDVDERKLIHDLGGNEPLASKIAEAVKDRQEVLSKYYETYKVVRSGSDSGWPGDEQRERYHIVNANGDLLVEADNRNLAEQKLEDIKNFKFYATSLPSRSVDLQAAIDSMPINVDPLYPQDRVELPEIGYGAYMEGDTIYLEGDALTVSRPGLVDFYNKTLPRFVNKYIKSKGGNVAPRNIDIPQATYSEAEQVTYLAFDIPQQLADEMETVGQQYASVDQFGLPPREPIRVDGSGPNGELKVLSVFDGLGGARQALDNLSVPVKYYASENDPQPIKIVEKNFPDTVQLGDIEELTAEGVDLAMGRVDLLCGGSPCQDLSIANKGRQGLAGKDSKLFYEFVRLLDTVKPKYFLFENVARISADVAEEITRQLGVPPIMYDAANVSAQRRKRLYWTNIPQQDLVAVDAKLIDVLESDVDPTLYHSDKAIDYMNRLIGTTGKPRWSKGYHSDARNDKSATLTRNLRRGVPHNVLIDQDERIRRFDTREVERLAGLPDDYTDVEGLTYNQRLGAIGNGFQVQVIEHIMRGLNKPRTEYDEQLDLLEQLTSKADVESFGEMTPERLDLYLQTAVDDHMLYDRTTVAEPGSKAIVPVPKKTQKGYKVLRTMPSRDGVYPLYIDAQTPIPFDEWIPADFGTIVYVKLVDGKKSKRDYISEEEYLANPQKYPDRVPYILGKGNALFAPRPGYHLSDYPAVFHIGGKGLKAGLFKKYGLLNEANYRKADEVIVEAEVPADIDWQPEADSRSEIAKDKDIKDQIPLGGYYTYKTNPKMVGAWMIAASVKLNRILTRDEVNSIGSPDGPDLPMLDEFIVRHNIPFDDLNATAQKELKDHYPDLYNVMTGGGMSSADVEDFGEPRRTITGPEREENFRRWFGDSKVVDESGEPLVLYRGDNKPVGQHRALTRDEGGSGGIYLTTDPEIASNYARTKESAFENDDDFRPFTTVVLPDDYYSNELLDSPYEQGEPINIVEAALFLRDEDKARLRALATDPNQNLIFERRGYTEEEIEAEGGRYPFQSERDFERTEKSVGDIVSALNEVYVESASLWDDGGPRYDRYGTSFLVDAIRNTGVFKSISYDNPMIPKPNVTAVYASLKNPYDVTEVEESEITELVAKFYEIARPPGQQEVLQDWQRDLLADRLKKRETIVDVPPALRMAMRELGYDGIRDATAGTITGGKPSHVVYIALYPEQIKSAYGNIGTFDPNNPDITRADVEEFGLPRDVVTGPERERNFREWFGNSVASEMKYNERGEFYTEPLKLYRGDSSPIPDDELGIIETTDGGSGAIWLTPRPRLADHYAQHVYMPGTKNKHGWLDHTTVTLRGQTMPITEVEDLLTDEDKAKIDQFVESYDFDGIEDKAKAVDLYQFIRDEATGIINGLDSIIATRAQDDAEAKTISTMGLHKLTLEARNDYDRKIQNRLLDFIRALREANIFDDIVYDEASSSAPSTMAVYASLQNPYRPQSSSMDTRESIVERIKEIDKNKRHRLRAPLLIHDNILAGTILPKIPATLRQALQESGYDGVVYEASIGFDELGDEVYEDMYVVFDQSQIKSATGNVGTFDPNLTMTQADVEEFDDEGASDEEWFDAFVLGAQERTGRKPDELEPEEGTTRRPDEIEPEESKTRRFAETAERSGYRVDNRTYEPIANEDVAQEVEREMRESGVDLVAERLMQDTDPSAMATARGAAVMAAYTQRAQEARDAGDVTGAEENALAAVRVADTLATRLTEAGQMIQAVRLMTRLAPATIYYYAQKKLNEINRGGTETRPIDAQAAQKLTEIAEKAEDLTKLTERGKEIAPSIERVLAGEDMGPGDVADVKAYVEEVKQSITGGQTTEGKPKKRDQIRALVGRLIKTKASEARKRLQAKGIRLGVGFDPGDLRDWSEIGAEHIYEAGTKFAGFYTYLTENLGLDKGKHIREIYKESLKIIKDDRAQAKKSLRQILEIEKLANAAETMAVIDYEDALMLAKLASQVRQSVGEEQEQLAATLQNQIHMLQEPTVNQKIKSFQTMAMLLNTRTLGVNIVSNEIFWNIEQASKLAAAGFDKIASSISGQDRKVTFRWTGRGGAFESAFMMDEYRSGLMQGGGAAWRGEVAPGMETRYDLPPGSAFGGKGWLQKAAERLSGKTWDREVNIPAYFERALGVALRGFDFAGAKRARNYTLAEAAYRKGLREGISEQAMDAYIDNYIAKSYELEDAILQSAMDQALYVTFQDTNAASQLASKAKGLLNQVPGFMYDVMRGNELNMDRQRFGLGELLLKFPKTPTNLFMRAIDYSPLGLYHLIKLSNRYNREVDEVSEGQLIVDMARVAFGTTGMTAMGYWLEQIGILTGKGDEDYDEERFMRDELGAQPYAINLSAFWRLVTTLDLEQATPRQTDKYYSYNWLQPMAISLAVGANVSQSYTERRATMDESDLAAGDLLDIATNGIQAGGTGFSQSYQDLPMLQALSQVSGQRDFFGLDRTIAAAPSSFVPSSVRMARRLVDPIVRDPYSGDFLDKMVNLTLNKIPFLSERVPERYALLPERDELGEVIFGMDGEPLVPPMTYEDFDPDTADAREWMLYTFNTLFGFGRMTEYDMDPFLSVILEPYGSGEEGDDVGIPSDQPPTRRLPRDMGGGTVRLTSEDRNTLRRIFAQEYGKQLNPIDPQRFADKLSDEQQIKTLRKRVLAARKATTKYWRDNLQHKYAINPIQEN